MNIAAHSSSNFFPDICRFFFTVKTLDNGHMKIRNRLQFAGRFQGVHPGRVAVQREGR